MYSDFYAYQKIANTSFYIALPTFMPLIATYKLDSSWIRYLSHELFKNVKPDDFNTLRLKAEELFNTKVRIAPVKTLSSFDQQMLYRWGILGKSYYGGHAAKVAFSLPDKNYYIELGTLKPSFFLLNFELLIVALALVILFILAWVVSYPFYRSLQKLQLQLARFGKGDLSYRTHIPKGQALTSLQQSIDATGTQLQSLIDSHKDLTNAIAHEIKTPLARIQFALQILKESQTTTSQAYIDSANEDINELNQLISELLLHVKFDRKNNTLQPKLANLSAFLADQLAFYREKHPDKSWHFDCDKSNIPSLFDAKNLKRALDNILINAYIHGGNHIYITLTHSDTNAVIYIEDNGHGINDDSYDKIFKPFETLSKSRSKKQKGHGLGLAISQKIIQTHGGNISAQKSPKHGGLQFVIELPLNSSHQTSEQKI